MFGKVRRWLGRRRTPASMPAPRRTRLVDLIADSISTPRRSPLHLPMAIPGERFRPAGDDIIPAGRAQPALTPAAEPMRDLRG